MQIRLRNDLVFVSRHAAGSRDWVVKDPLSFQHFLFTESEFFLLQQFDGVQSAEKIIERWRTRFQTGSLSLKQVQQFARRLVSDNLVIVNHSGLGVSIRHQFLLEKGARQRWWSNPLAIRLRGLNLTWLLRWLDGLGWLLFHPATMIIVMLASLIVLLFLFGHFEELAVRLPTMQQLLSSQGLAGMVVTIAMTKVLHELGHALALRRFGGECFEVGVILLALIPTLYCNVSDVWTIPERWKRMVVSFAGMYVEIGIAALAAVAWFWTPPSLLNALLFNVVLLCSVSTVLVNGNPLLRYDGYYLLTDALGFSDLSRDANAAVNRFGLSLFFRTCDGTKASFGLLCFGVASLLYRWIVLFAILGGIILALGIWVSHEVGYVVAGALLLGVVLNTIRGTAVQMLGIIKPKTDDALPGRMRFSANRAIISLLLLAAAVWFVGYFPLPHRVYCRAELTAANPARVYAPNRGRLVAVAAGNDIVTANERIGMLENKSLERDQNRKRRELAYVHLQLQEISLRINQDPTLVPKMGELQQRVRSLEEELAVVESDYSQLQILAPINGIVVSPVAKPRQSVDDVSLPRWVGSINEDQNRGCFVSRSEHLLTIVAPGDKAVSLVVRESDMDFVELGQPVYIRFELRPETVIAGTVSKIFRQEVLTRFDDPEFESYRDQRGQLQYLARPYRLDVGNVNLPAQVLIGSSGRAKIAVRPQTIYERGKRLLEWSLMMRTF